MQPHKFCILIFTLCTLSSASFAQSSAEKQGYYFSPTFLHSNWIIGPQPAEGSAESAVDLEAVRRVEQTRTPTQVAQAVADDKEQDIFIFASVVGEKFTAAGFPLTNALSTHIHSDEGVAGDPLKSTFARPRPYQLDKHLHPVCKVTDVHNSYPSGHALGGYLFALTLIEMLPEKREAIMQRADEYAHNRIVCGVHYPSDLRASRELAYVVFGNMLAVPLFQKDLEAARNEIRAKLNLAVAN